MLFFAVVQYNDPDRLLWITIYTASATAAGLVGFFPQQTAKTSILALYFLAIIASIGTTFFFWPQTPKFWYQEVWWNNETVREGIGMMIVTIILVVTFMSVWCENKRIANSTEMKQKRLKH